MSFTVADVVAEAGVGDPWELAAQVPSDAGPVTELGTTFTTSGGHARDATAAAGAADELTAQSFVNNGTEVYDAIPATAATRVALGDGGAQLVEVGDMLGRVATQLTASRGGITRAISALDAEIAAIVAESDRLSRTVFPTQAEADQAERALRDRMVTAVRTHGGSVAAFVDAYDAALRSGLGVLAGQGFGPADPALDPAAAPAPPPPGGTPEEVNAWWTGLSWQQQAELLRTSPDLLGNLDGLPAEVRDTANRARLPSEQARVAAEITETQRRLDELDAQTPASDTEAYGNAFTALGLADRLQTLRDHQAALAAIERTVGLSDRQLLTLDTSGELVLAAVANGDVDTAAHVAVLTAGVGTTVQPPPPDGLGASIHVSLERYDFRLNQLRSSAEDALSATSGESGGVATVAWMGYAAPQPAEILDPGRSLLNDGVAYGGAEQLAGFLNGIDAARPQDPHLTAIGHSYGALTTGLAARQATGVDEVVLQGAPGLGTSDLSDLQVPAGHTYVAESNGDLVADAAWFGTDPNQLDGITNLSTQAAITPDGPMRASEGHYPVSGPSSYLSPGTTSQYNLMQVIIGRRDRIVHDDNWDVGDYLNAPFS